MDIEFKITEDGSHTLYVPALNEHYHSTHGAITESMHVFINAGLKFHQTQECLTVFEVGFGTGLNTLLTCLESLEDKIQIRYMTLEKYPLLPEIIRKLNYAEIITRQKAVRIYFDLIHNADWGMPVKIHPGFTLCKIKDDLISYKHLNSYDVIYFDAFSFEKQPEMWEKDIFKRLVECMNPGAVLTTYSAKGQLRRNLHEFGLQVELIPGPPGKREMIRAIKETI